MKKDRIKMLNKAYQLFGEALKIVKDGYPKDPDVEYYFWKMSRLNTKMHKYLLQKFNQEVIDIEFDHMIRRLEEEDNE